MIDATQLPAVRAQLERDAAAQAAPQDSAQPPATKCTEIMAAIAGGLQANARLWRRPGQCAVWAEHQCTGDQQACPFRR